MFKVRATDAQPRLLRKNLQFFTCCNDGPVLQSCHWAQYPLSGHDFAAMALDPCVAVVNGSRNVHLTNEKKFLYHFKAPKSNKEFESCAL